VKKEFTAKTQRTPREAGRMRRGLLKALVCLLGVLSVLAANYFLFFHRLADRDLWSSHEARAGMDAQTVLDDGAWGLPHLFSGEAELQKPPLYYWLVAAIALLRGGAVDGWAVRLPAAVAAVLCVVGLGAFGRARGRVVAGLTAAVVLATALHFTWLARIGRIDMPLCLTVSVAVGAMVLARRVRAPGPFSRDPKESAGVSALPFGSRLNSAGSMFLLLIGYVAMAAGVLLKGPIGAVLPVAVIGAHLLFEGEIPPPWRGRAWLRLIHDLGLWWGAPLVLALTLPWFLWADAVTHGEFFRVFIVRHNIERGLGDGDLKVHPWWFYGPQFASDFLPWSVLLPVAAFVCWRRGYLRTDPEARLGLAWLLAVMGVLSCASFKRADYLLPAYPGAALFLGCIFANEERRWREAEPRAIWAGLCLLPCLLAAAMIAAWMVRVEHGLPAEEPFRDYRRFAAEVRTRAPRPDEVVFFRTEAHALAFHVGRPLAVLVEWKELEERIAQTGVRYVVMPEESAAQAPQSLPRIRFEEVLRNTDLSGGRHERPLVFMQATSGQ
jgi:4-amino-4-deoxy-L-arabinose transferase-like glycosyltransferase